MQAMNYGISWHKFIEKAFKNSPSDGLFSDLYKISI